MPIQLRPFASNVNWMAPYALAAQLTARAGETTGQGIAQAGQNLASGIENLTQKRERAAVRTQQQSNWQAELGMQQQRIDMAKEEAKNSLLETVIRGNHQQANERMQLIPPEQWATDPQLHQLNDSTQMAMTSLQANIARKQANTGEGSCPPSG